MPAIGKTRDRCAEGLFSRKSHRFRRLEKTPHADAPAHAGARQRQEAVGMQISSRCLWRVPTEPALKLDRSKPFRKTVPPGNDTVPVGKTNKKSDSSRQNGWPRTKGVLGPSRPGRCVCRTSEYTPRGNLTRELGVSCCALNLFNSVRPNANVTSSFIVTSRPIKDRHTLTSWGKKKLRGKVWQPP